MPDLNSSVYWLLFGLFSVCLEVLVPGVSLLSIGLAAILTGLLCSFFILSIQLQFLAFAFSSIILTIACKKWVVKVRKKNLNLKLNDHTKKWVGYEFYTDCPIEKKPVRMPVSGSYWTIEGPSLPANTKVTVKKVVDSHTLQVEPAEL